MDVAKSSVYLRAVFWRNFILGVTIGFLLCAGTAVAQNNALQYPIPQFRDSLYYPVPVSHALSGNFGEPRHGMFHAGLDIRTEEKTGLAVYAAADGYIWRVTVRHNGFGRALYLKHDDSTSSVYAHLERFVQPLEADYYRRTQYTRSFQQDYRLPPNFYRVQKGELIGFSGNTGDSGGPHLHFEVRDTGELPVNPLPYYPRELSDRITPFISLVGFEPLSPASRVNGKCEQWRFFPKQSAHTYSWPQPIFLDGPVGFEFTGYDRLDGSLNYKGLYNVRLLLDSTLIFSYRMNRLSYLEANLFPTFLDIRCLRDFNTWLQKCYIEPGNRQGFYDTVVNKGKIHLRDDDAHRLELQAIDLHGNVARFVTSVQRSKAPSSVSFGTSTQKYISHEIRLGSLFVRTSLPFAVDSGRITVRFANRTVKINPAYTADEQAVYILPIRMGDLPKEILVGGQTIPLDLAGTILPNKAARFTLPDGMATAFDAGAVFDTVHMYLKDFPLTDAAACSKLYSIGSYYTPLKGGYSLTLPADRRAIAFLPRQVLVCERRLAGGYIPMATTNRTAYVRRFGNYCLVGDSTPPVIKSLFRTKLTSEDPLTYLMVKLSDNLAGIKAESVQAWLDDRWEPMEYYSFGGTGIVWFTSPLVSGEHTLEIVAHDQAGNQTKRTFPFTWTPR